MTPEGQASKPGEVVPLADSATYPAEDRETWALIDGELRRIRHGIILHNVHPRGSCVTPGRCVIHNPTVHHMRLWPVRWDPIRKSVLRECKHGKLHPDPDSSMSSELVALLVEYLDPHERVCDGCCRP